MTPTVSATIRDLVLGIYPYRFSAPVTGLEFTARQSQSQNASGGFTFDGPGIADPAVLTLPLFAFGETPAEAIDLMDAVAAVWAPSDTDLELTLDLAGSVRVFYGRPAGFTPSYANVLQHSFGEILATFARSDPLWYSASVTTTPPLIIGVATGGMPTPMPTPMVTAASGTIGETVVDNTGSAPAHWTAQITATSTLATPRLFINGRMIQLNGVLETGETVELDSRDESASIGGAPRAWIDHTSTSSWQLPPGPSAVKVTAVSGDGYLVLTFRAAHY